MQDLWYDKFNGCFTTEREGISPPERYTRYFSDNGSGNLSEVHVIGTINGDQLKTLKFEYKAEDQKDWFELEKKRDRFFKDNNVDDYLTMGNKYYTLEMTITKDHFDQIIEQLPKTEKE